MEANTNSIDLSSIPDYSSANEVHLTFSHAVSSCPTKNYAVVYQPGVTVADFESSYLSIGSHAHTNLVVEKIQGNVDVVAVVNTILMDCLHAPEGVKRVETLDTSRLEVASFEKELIKKSIIYIPLPALSSRWGVKDRAAVLAKNDAYLKDVVSTYFDNKDYTLIYISATSGEAVKESSEAVGDGIIMFDDAEVPFVFDETA